MVPVALASSQLWCSAQSFVNQLNGFSRHLRRHTFFTLPITLTVCGTTRVHARRGTETEDISWPLSVSTWAPHHLPHPCSERPSLDEEDKEVGGCTDDVEEGEDPDVDQEQVVLGLEDVEIGKHLLQDGQQGQRQGQQKEQQGVGHHRHTLVLLQVVELLVYLGPSDLQVRIGSRRMLIAVMEVGPSGRGWRPWPGSCSTFLSTVQVITRGLYRRFQLGAFLAVMAVSSSGLGFRPQSGTLLIVDFSSFGQSWRPQLGMLFTVMEVKLPGLIQRLQLGTLLIVVVSPSGQSRRPQCDSLFTVMEARSSALRRRPQLGMLFAVMEFSPSGLSRRPQPGVPFTATEARPPQLRRRSQPGMFFAVMEVGAPGLGRRPRRGLAVNGGQSAERVLGQLGQTDAARVLVQRGHERDVGHQHGEQRAVLEEAAAGDGEVVQQAMVVQVERGVGQVVHGAVGARELLCLHLPLEQLVRVEGEDEQSRQQDQQLGPPEHEHVMLAQGGGDGEVAVQAHEGRGHDDHLHTGVSKPSQWQQRNQLHLL